MILHTADRSCEDLITKKLRKAQIPYLIEYINDTKMNIFFGHEYCIEVISHFDNKNLDLLSDEEDFILGVMLGYDRIQQCKRYLTRKIKDGKIDDLVG